MKLTAPESVRAELRRGLAWHKEGHGGAGLVPATVSWARKLAEGGEINRDKAVKMRAWLARHEVDKKGKGFSPGDGYPSPGRVAWALWGGDPAVGWSAKLVRFFEGDMNKRSYDAEQRRVMADKGEAMPDGSFPIADKADLRAAMRSIGRANDPAKAKAHIRRRAKALGLEDMLTPAFAKIARAQIRKGYRVHYAYGSVSAPELPIPCTPADLTPGMQAGFPTEMQGQFCAVYNALCEPIPTGPGYPAEQAFFMAYDRMRQLGWCEAPGEQWYRVEVMGLTKDYDTTEESTMEEMDDAVVEAQKALAAHLEGLKAANPDVEKIGRMISAANHKKLMKAHAMISEGAAMLKGTLPTEDEETTDEPAQKLRFDVAFDKVDTEKMQVFGYAYVAKNADGTAVVDHSGDIVDTEALEKAIYASFGKLTSREMHKRDAGAYLIESVYMTHEKLKKMNLPTKGHPDGAWWVGVQVTDDKLWAKIKDGTYSAFSIGGSGKRVPV